MQNSSESLVAELKDYQQKLAIGIANLKSMGELPLGVTPHEVILELGKLRLLHYQNTKASVTPVPFSSSAPLIIVYALVNRPYMTDLQENRSLIRGLLDTGQDVYLVDWGYPGADDAELTLDDYLNTQLNTCVDEVCRRHDLEQVNLLGICQGGVFSLCYSAMYPQKIRNLVTMVTPVDFQTPDNMLGHWVKRINIDDLVDAFGNVPGAMLNQLFLSLKPYRLMGQKYVHLLDIVEDKAALENFVRMEKWIFDSPDQAAEAFRQFAKDFVQQGKLVKGEVIIGKQRVDLSNVTMPVLNIYAEQDHLVPPSSAKCLKKFVGTTDYSALSFKGGHIGIYVSSRAQKTVPPAIGLWLNQRTSE